MSGTTSPLGFPYPTGTDDLRDGDNTIQALADAVDDYFVGADVTLTVGANLTIGASKAYRRGRMVIISVENLVSTGAISAGATILTLPSGARPPDNIRGVLYNFNASSVVLVQVMTTGAINTGHAIASGSGIYGSVAIPI